MIGRDKALSTLAQVLAASKADAAEAVLVGGSTSTTRYANSAVHQNVSVDSARVTVRVVLGTRIGTASTNSLTGPDLRRTVRAAMDIARRQKPNADFPGFASPADYRAPEAFDENTAALTPKQRAQKLKKVFTRGARRSYSMAGAFTTGSGEVAVANSNGVQCYHARTSASLTCIATGPDSTGYGAAASRAAADIDAAAVAASAVDKCRRSRSPKDMAPGSYEVVLEPAAIAEIFNWLAFVTFGSRGFQDGSSCLAGRIGERLMGEEVTILDDAFDPACPGLPFDFEGTPRQRVELISRGIARSVVHNRLSARRAGTVSTGHALPPEEAAEGAIPLNLQLAAGSQSAAELVAGVENGLLVTRFHYLNGFLDPRRAMMTGMTRDGLLRIRKGRIVGGVRNLRFTDSMLDVFSRVVGISSERFLAAPSGDPFSMMHLPTVRVSALAFTGKTEF